MGNDCHSETYVASRLDDALTAYAAVVCDKCMRVNADSTTNMAGECRIMNDYQ